MQPLKNDRFVIPKSRYDSISTYLSPEPYFHEKYNDVELVQDKKIYQELVDAGKASCNNHFLFLLVWCIRFFLASIIPLLQ